MYDCGVYLLEYFNYFTKNTNSIINLFKQDIYYKKLNKFNLKVNVNLNNNIISTNNTKEHETVIFNECNNLSVNNSDNFNINTQLNNLNTNNLSIMQEEFRILDMTNNKLSNFIKYNKDSSISYDNYNVIHIFDSCDIVNNSRLKIKKIIRKFLKTN